MAGPACSPGRIALCPRVRVTAEWSQFFGLVGAVVEVTDSYVLVSFPGVPGKLLFGLDAVEQL